jgi:type VI secretion system protein ImpC
MEEEGDAKVGMEEEGDAKGKGDGEIAPYAPSQAAPVPWEEEDPFAAMDLGEAEIFLDDESSPEAPPAPAAVAAGAGPQADEDPWSSATIDALGLEDLDPEPAPMPEAGPMPEAAPMPEAGIISEILEPDGSSSLGDVFLDGAEFGIWGDEDPFSGGIIAGILGRAFLEGGNPDLESEEEISRGLAYALGIYLKAMEAGGDFSVAIIDEVVGGLDQTTSEWLDATLHHPEFRELSRSWLSLKALTERVDFEENIVLNVLNISKSEIYEDFTDVPEITMTSLHRLAYSEEYGQFGGKPYAVLLGAYEFTASPSDFFILRQLANLGAMAHAPFITNVGPGFFGLRSFSELSGISDINAVLEEKRYLEYAKMRNRENSRYLALVLPGFLGRLPYGPSYNPVGEFNYEERGKDPDNDYVWGYSSFLLVSGMARSFAKSRWYVEFTGVDGGGLISDLPALEYESMGETQNRISTEALIGERLENQLSSLGFIPFTALGNSGKSSFNGAQTVLKPVRTQGDSSASFNHRISTMLPYMMIINRLAHYIKVLQRENIGTWKDNATLEREINLWVNQYVTDMDNPSPLVRAKRPLRSARVEVTDLPGTPGWHEMTLKIRPHVKFMGANFTLTLRGRLDQVDFVGN